MTTTLPLSRRLLAASLVAAMAVASAVAWVVNPLAWLWIASQMQDAGQPSMGLYLLVLAGIAVTAVVLGWCLSRLNHAHAELTGRDTSHRERLPWLRSMRDTPDEVRGSVLESVMVCSVGVAAVAAGVWFFFFAGSSLPS